MKLTFNRYRGVAGPLGCKNVCNQGNPHLMRSALCKHGDVSVLTLEEFRQPEELLEWGHFDRTEQKLTDALDQRLSAL